MNLNVREAEKYESARGKVSYPHDGGLYLSFYLVDLSSAVHMSPAY